METISDLLHRHPGFRPAKGVYEDVPTDEEVWAANSVDFYEMVSLGMLTDTVEGDVIVRTKEEKYLAMCEKYGRTGRLAPDEEERIVEMGYQRLVARMAKAGVPRMFLSVPADERYNESFSKGYGLYIHGPVGTGKTTHACAALKGWMRGNPIGDPRFVTAPQLLSTLASTYGTGMTQEQAMQSFTACPVLVIDDLGKESLDDRNVSRLWRVINDRCANMLPTIITSQLMRSALLSEFDEDDATSIGSRLKGFFTELVTDGPDMRIYGSKQ